MIGCLRAYIRFKQKPFKWLVLAGLLFLRVTHTSQVIVLKVHFLNIARRGQNGDMFFPPTPLKTFNELGNKPWKISCVHKHHTIHLNGPWICFFFCFFFSLSLLCFIHYFLATTSPHDKKWLFVHRYLQTRWDFLFSLKYSIHFLPVRCLPWTHGDQTHFYQCQISCALC